MLRAFDDVVLVVVARCQRPVVFPVLGALLIRRVAHIDL